VVATNHCSASHARAGVKEAEAAEEAEHVDIQVVAGTHMVVVVGHEVLLGSEMIQHSMEAQTVCTGLVEVQLKLEPRQWEEEPLADMVFDEVLVQDMACRSVLASLAVDLSIEGVVSNLTMVVVQGTGLVEHTADQNTEGAEVVGT
jgi:hypothetical protein